LRAGSVSKDWRTPLSSEKNGAYLHVLERLETSYAMFSVNLDEALGMRRTGRLQKSFQVLSVAPALCERLSRPLLASLRAMLRHARHFGVTPNLAPLDPQNFHSAKSQRAARYNSLLGKILLTRRSQFVTKIEALADLTEELASGFQTNAESLTANDSLQPDRDWEFLDAAHYDLNTCLRETVVILKCFLHALSNRQLSQFQDFFREQLASSSSFVSVRDRSLAHRRMTLIKGQ
jgi:hypothetical protein